LSRLREEVEEDLVARDEGERHRAEATKANRAIWV
jgi:hypothetical protein